MSARRLCFFRWFARLLPLFALGLLELALYLGGYGYPTSFFLKANEHGQAMLTDNPWFGWRFFPSSVARTPLKLYFPGQKPPDTIRVFVFGESAAMGDPEPAYGFARQLERLLQARHPDKQIEVINTAMTAINSHVVRLIGRDCRPRQGDFWLVYAGNNEVIGPFGAGTVFGRQAPSLTAVRAVLALKTTRMGQWLANLIAGRNEPERWEGLELFLKSQMPRGSPRLNRVYSSFAANLGDIADFGRQAGATVLLSTMPVNLRDFPPLASAHRPDLPPEKLAEWQKLFSAGTQAQTAGLFTEALGAFDKAAEIDDGWAELVFQRACCEKKLKQTAAAESHFRLARDLDTFRFRADSRLNEITRQTAKAKAVPLVDADKEFERYDSEDLFYDHVHLNFAGNYHVALLLAAEMEKLWPGARSNNLPWLTETEVARRLAFTRFDQRRVAEEMRARLRKPPFLEQSNFRIRDEHWRETIALPVALADCASNYQAALALAPDDPVLHANFARLLAESGDHSGAAKECAEVTRLLPHSAEGWANLGHFARLSGETEPAKKYLEEALKCQPDSAMVRTELGDLAMSLGDAKDAERQFRSVLRLEPGYTDARVNLGLLLANQGNAAGAAAEYREALRWQTNNVEARVNLAILLAAHGQRQEALALEEEAVELAPENPIIRINLARLLVADNRPAEAIVQLQAALKQQPGLAEIHFELGNLLAGLGRDPEALGELAEAVRLRPDFAAAHSNYGAALARCQRFAAAVPEFQEALRLNPQDQHTQQMLESARLACPK